MSVKILQIHKREVGKFEFIQDKFDLNFNNKTYALADGTTQSFNSGKWAEIITREFVSNPKFEVHLLNKSLKKSAEYFKSIEFEYNSNPAIAALQRQKIKNGGTATLIGFQIIEPNKLNYVSCGDSNIFHIRNDAILKGYPYDNLEKLNKNNAFLNTEKLLAENEENSLIETGTLSLKKDDIILLATDAMSRFILGNEAILKNLLAINSFNEFHTFALKHWDNKLLEEDDLSLIIVLIDNNDTIDKFLPPSNFAFPEANLYPGGSFTPHLRNSFEMNQLKNEIKDLFSEIKALKEKTYRQNIFSLTIITLLLISLLVNGFMLTKIQSLNKEPIKTLESIEKDSNEMGKSLNDKKSSKDNTTNEKIEEVKEVIDGEMEKVNEEMDNANEKTDEVSKKTGETEKDESMK